MSETTNQPRTAVSFVQVSAEQQGQRIDNFLMARMRQLPKGAIYKLLRTGQVRVNKKRVKAVYRIQEGDEIRIPPVRQEPEKGEVSIPQGLLNKLDSWILLEDDALMVLNKPAGIAVHGGSGLGYGLIDILRAARPNAPFLELVHRLDRETSGCLLIAKSRDILTQLHELIRNNGLMKRYLALVDGVWEGKERVVETMLQSGKKGGKRAMKVEDDGRTAISHFRPLKRFDSATLMQIEIETGRTHQIRVQSAHLGHPIIGDSKYGNHELNRAWKKKGLGRMFLHSSELAFQLPVSGRKYHSKAPLGDELEVALKQLQRK
jgi:23S rRNA pseudouridine955/2504/2580 synthase